ncbi:hypothetical protein ACNKHW_12670 [Shigella flexneri]
MDAHPHVGKKAVLVICPIAAALERGRYFFQRSDAIQAENMTREQPACVLAQQAGANARN